MKVSYVLGILLAGALSMGCVAQAGTDESSQAEGLTADQGAQVAPQYQQQQQLPAAKQHVQLAPGATGQVIRAEVPVGLEDTTGLDPSTVQDDGDGKEPDPHPWHATTAARASH